MFPFIKTSIKLAAALLLMASIAFSQTTVLNSKGDTTICFTMPQARFLLKQSVQLGECQKLFTVCEMRRNYLDSAFTSDSIVISDLNTVVSNKDKLLSLKTIEIGEVRENNRTLKKQLRRQKVYKWLAIGAAAVYVGWQGYRRIRG